MNNPLNISNHTLFLVMVGIVLFRFAAKRYIVYSNTFTGGLYEMLALPTLVLPVLLVALVIWNLFRTKGMIKYD